MSEKSACSAHGTPYTFLKRFFDLCFALLGFLSTLPILLVACFFIVMDSPGSPIFSQQRVGYKNKYFTLYKLRTMTSRTHDKNGKKLRDRERVTKVGRILRKLSLDELPQFINIIRGDMSFVGPRPLLIRYFPYYTYEELHRHDVRPGITGLAQINGRSNLQWEERFNHDLFYVNNLSFRLDLEIVSKTIIRVFKHENTSTIRPKNLVDFDIHRAGQERKSE